MKSIIVLFVSLLALPIYAQTSRGTVSGTVLDSSGAVIFGSIVELTNLGTNVTRTAKTNEAGIYRFDAVELGLHQLKIHMPGFGTFLHESFLVEANRTVTIDATLEAGGIEEVIEVTATAETALTKDAPLRGGSLSGSELIRLPFAYGEPFWAGSHPGVIFPANSYTFTSGWGFSVNGQRPR